MHRLARTLTVVSLAGLLAAGSLPAQAKAGRSEHRGKKPIGKIVSFDAATSQLVVDLVEGEDLTAAVDPDAQVKLDHRGHSRKGRAHSHGNPTRGSLDDLLPGTPVLRLKLEDEVVTKIRLRALPAETPAPADKLAEDADDGDDVEDPAETETPEVEDAEETDERDDSDDDPDDDHGDLEDALPPLPVPQP